MKIFDPIPNDRRRRLVKRVAGNEHLVAVFAGDRRVPYIHPLLEKHDGSRRVKVDLGLIMLILVLILPLYRWNGVRRRSTAFWEALKHLLLATSSLVNGGRNQIITCTPGRDVNGPGQCQVLPWDT